MRKLLVSVAIAFLAVACGDDADDNDNGGGDPTGASITGTVSYSGSSTGSVMIALYSGTIPGGPPQASEALGEVTFPVDYTLDAPPVGDWYVFAFFDIGSNNPTVPGSEDKSTFNPTVVSITADSGAEVRDLDLVD